MQKTPAIFYNSKFWIGSLLLITILAAIWPMPAYEPALPKEGKAKQSIQTAIVTVTFAPLEAAIPDKATTIGDLFPQQSWTPPPLQVIQQTAPVAPPLPFTFGGRYTEGSNVTIFLMEGNQMHKVKQGDTIKGTYLVEKIEQASISFTYLPMSTSHILPTGVLRP